MQKQKKSAQETFGITNKFITCTFTNETNDTFPKCFQPKQHMNFTLNEKKNINSFCEFGFGAIFLHSLRIEDE